MVTHAQNLLPRSKTDQYARVATEAVTQWACDQFDIAFLKPLKKAFFNKNP